MKKSVLLSFLFFIALSGFSQTEKASLYNQAKANGDLQSMKQIAAEISAGAKQIIQPVVHPASSVPIDPCNCMFQIDTTFSVVPFVGYPAPDYRNDDASSPLISLPFTVSLYGTNYTSCYINNNGNVSFVNPSAVFSSTGFPNATDVMVAPFWADVDTRDSVSGLVYYKVTSNALIVVWDSVGYYAVHSDKLNTFQILITDTTSGLLPSGQNISFCYGDMQWTTGDASSGINGFGGVPATVGANNANGIDYFQLGLFDTSGTQFDGPFTTTDGVDFLDLQYVEVGGTQSQNVAPVLISSVICDTINVSNGDTLFLVINTSSPEANQNTNLVVSSSGIGSMSSYKLSGSIPSSMSVSSLSGNAFKTTIQVNPDAANIGYYDLFITATDDYVVKPASHTIHKVLNFSQAVGISDAEKIVRPLYPNPAHDVVYTPFFNAKSVLTDLSGRVVLLAETDKSGVLALQKVVPGVYLLQVFSENGTPLTKQRIVVE